jgi:membrane protein
LSFFDAMAGGLYSFARGLRRRIVDHRVADLAAMLTYYAVMAIFPLTLFALTMAFVALPRHVVDRALELGMQAVPSQVAPMIEQHVRRLEATAAGSVALVSALVAMWSGSRGVNALRVALNQASGLTETRSWWRREAIALAVTLGIVLAAIIAGATLALGPEFLRWIGATAAVAISWSLLYRVLPNRKRRPRVFTPGAVIGVLIWFAAGEVFSLYVAHFGRFEPTYGALAGAILFLVWLWLSSIALIVGAEIDDTLDTLMRKEQPVRSKTPTPNEQLTVRTSEPPAPRAEDGVGTLARRLGENLTSLAKRHAELARAEVAHDVRRAAIDVAASALGALVAIVGFAMLCTTAVIALAPEIHALWLRMLIMSGVYLVSGTAIIGWFARRLRGNSVNAPRSAEEARQTIETLKELRHA